MPDIYANQGHIQVVPTLNALTFAELATFVSVFEKKAFIITRIDYFFTVATLQEFDAETDWLMFGLSTSNTFNTPTLAVPQIIDFNQFILNMSAAGVSSHFIHEPFVKDLSTMPGGGLIVPSRPIFAWMLSSGFSAPGQMNVRIYFLVKDLKADEYWELVEATRLVGA